MALTTANPIHHPGSIIAKLLQECMRVSEEIMQTYRIVSFKNTLETQAVKREVSSFMVSRQTNGLSKKKNSNVPFVSDRFPNE